MKTIKLKKLTIINYRGIKKSEIEFSDDTSIFGKNKVGKTTHYAALCHLLTGKDEQDRQNHEIFDNTVEYTPDNAITAIIEGEFEIDGIMYKLKRTSEQKWQRKRGSGDMEKTDDKHEVFIDDVPRTMTEFKSWVSEMICDETIFKIITNTRYFTSLHWEKQRSVLMQICGDINSSDLREDFTDLLKEIVGLSKKEFQAKIANLKKPISERIKAIPGAISEYESNIASDINFLEVEKSIESKRNEISDIDKKMQGDADSIKPIIEKRNEQLRIISNKEVEISKSRNAYIIKQDEQPNELRSQIRAIKQANERIERDNEQLKEDYRILERKKSLIEESIKILSKEKESLYPLIDEVNERTFNGRRCSYCEQLLPEEKLIEQRKIFNDHKQTEINGIVCKGKRLASEILEKENLLKDIEEKLSLGLKQNCLESTEALEFKLASLEVISFEETEEYNRLSDELATLKANIIEIPHVDNSEITEHKKSLNSEIESLIKQLAKRDDIERIKLRVIELKAEQKKLGDELARLEGLEYKMKAYEQQKAEIMQERINLLFKRCKVDVFKRQKSGELEPYCEITDLNGVRFSVINNAEQQLIGLDIIRMFTEYYGLKAPVWCDNAESINEIPKQDTQIIKLYVSDDEKLRVELM